MGKAAGDVVQGRNGWLGDPAPTSPGLAPASLNLRVGFRPRPASLCHWVHARGWGECPQALRGLREPQQHLNSEGAHRRHPLDRRPASVSPAADMSSCQAASGRPETVVLNTTGHLGAVAGSGVKGLVACNSRRSGHRPLGSWCTGRPAGCPALTGASSRATVYGAGGRSAEGSPASTPQCPRAPRTDCESATARRSCPASSPPLAAA